MGSGRGQPEAERIPRQPHTVHLLRRSKGRRQGHY
nr:MAG TPA: hypothetical protein [Caudoviricetes sp.]